MTVSTSAIVEAPIEDVWRLISDFPNLMRWHPLIERCEADGADVGAVRTVHFADWWAAERLDRLDHDQHVVGYSVIDSLRPANIGVAGAITLTDAGDGKTRVDWVSGHRADNPHAAEVNAGLQAYYPVRIGHLRAALGLPAA